MKKSIAARFGAIIGITSLIIGGLLVTVTPSASADTLLIESFQHGSVIDSSAWVSGGSGGTDGQWPGGACLTAGGNQSQTPIPGCGSPTIDADGSGALRLTPNALARAGFALHNKALPTSGGLDITFDQAQYGAGGYAADGIAFFLVDGSTNLTEPGASGGGLGYSAGFDGVSSYGQGISHGLLGIGIDKWGNFSASGSTGSGCTSGGGAGSMGPGQTPNVVAIRGPGNGSAGYCWLGASSDLGNLLFGDNTRAGATVHVRVVVDPSTVAQRNVTVYLNGNQVVQVPAPQELLDATSFKFGFSGSTGAVTDIHEVWNLSIDSVIPVPDTSEATSTSTTTPPTTLPSMPTTSVVATDESTAPVATPVTAKPSYTG